MEQEAAAVLEEFGIEPAQKVAAQTEPALASPPLQGIRVVEMSHMVMGPSCGLILAQLGADVIKVEPPHGDKTRSLRGMGAGFFPVFSRGKRSVTIDLETEIGRHALFRLLASADVFIENFKDSTIQALGLESNLLREKFPRLLIAAHKGFLSGPYEHRPALDEVVQMQSGLAFMTGTRERPMRAGASVNDIMGGLFGAIGILSMLHRRVTTNQGGEVRVGLFENSLFLVGQHMAQYQLSGQPLAPMAERQHAWPIYDIFRSSDGVPVFVAVTTNSAWANFCREFGLDELLNDPGLETISDRIEARDIIIPIVEKELSSITVETLELRLEAISVPYARVNSPEEALRDPHVNRPGGLASVRGTDGRELFVPTIPMELDNRQFGSAYELQEPGCDNEAVFEELGFGAAEIEKLSGAPAERRTGRAQ